MESSETNFRKLISLSKKDLLRRLAEDNTVREWLRSNVNYSVSEGSHKLRGIKIFLSYATPDVEKVTELYEWLLAAGMKPWFAPRSIKSGEKWELAIQTAIQQSDFFIVCLSSNTVNKRGVIQKEIRTALEISASMLDDDIYLIPVRLEDCPVPAALQHLQYLDLFEAKGYNELMWAIQKGIERRHRGR